ncbi:MAG: DUF1624 domain-containing protein [Rhodoferax sp.]|nr:DUF1624 domain-containing protein [Rhodoferax sp.]
MPNPTTARYAAVDMLRGLAMVWMTLFHFSFDLQHFGYLQANFYADPFWTLQRAAIVSLFVFCAGLGQAIAVQQGQSWARFWKRWRQIAACALLVSAGSYAMFPASFIYFGILHGMALMLILARLLAGAGWRLWPLGALALALPWLAAPLHAAWPELDFLNGRAFNWLGLISTKPITEDYAPLFPWLGVMCLGLASGQWGLRQHAAALQAASAAAVAHAPLRGLAFLGRWSLGYYMLHQPVLIGVFSVLVLLR